jgi:acyl transferase domain-containing protein
MLFGEHVPPPAAGRALYAAEPEFRRAFDQACAWLEPELGAALARRWFGAETRADDRSGALATGFAVALQYALFTLLHAWGVEPDVVSGWGAGEYPAACAAGVLAWPDGLRLAVQRAQLMASLVPGAEIVRSLHGFRRSLARTPLRAAQRTLQLASRAAPLARAEVLEPEHFGRHVYHVGGPSRVDSADSQIVLGDVQLAVRGEFDGQASSALHTDECAALYALIARLYERGVDIDWSAFERPFVRERLSVPGYPFQRTRCWLEAPRSTPPQTFNQPAAAGSVHPLLRRMTAGPATPGLPVSPDSARAPLKQADGEWTASEPTKNTG